MEQFIKELERAKGIIKTRSNEIDKHLTELNNEIEKIKDETDKIKIINEDDLRKEFHNLIIKLLEKNKIILTEKIFYPIKIDYYKKCKLKIEEDRIKYRSLYGRYFDSMSFDEIEPSDGEEKLLKYFFGENNANAIIKTFNELSKKVKINNNLKKNFIFEKDFDLDTYNVDLNYRNINYKQIKINKIILEKNYNYIDINIEGDDLNKRLIIKKNDDEFEFLLLENDLYNSIITFINNTKDLIEKRGIITIIKSNDIKIRENLKNLEENIFYNVLEN